MRNRVTPRALHLIVTTITLALSGCTSMSASECRTVDWQTIGYEDGVAGRSGDYIGQHRKACAKFGVKPDFESYQMGREQGLHEYCQPENGFRVGERGNEYRGICPAALENAFLNAYNSGHHLYNLEARVANAATQLDAARRELNHVEKEIAEKSAAIISGDSSADDRAQALIDTKQLAERAGRLKSDIRQLEQDKAHYDIELENYRSTLSAAL
jgi:Protein of unknown function (DUF2799)